MGLPSVNRNFISESRVNRGIGHSRTRSTHHLRRRGAQRQRTEADRHRHRCHVAARLTTDRRRAPRACTDFFRCRPSENATPYAPAERLDERQR